MAGSYPFLLVADKAYDDEAGAPPLELCHPVGEGGLGYDDNVRPAHIPHQAHVAQQGNRLQSLAQALHRKKITFKKNLRHYTRAEYKLRKLSRNTKVKNKSLFFVPFHRPGSRWFHSQTVISSSLGHGSGNLSSYRSWYLQTHKQSSYARIHTKLTNKAT